MCCVVRSCVIGEVANKYIRVAVISFRFHFSIFCTLSRFLILLFVFYRERRDLACQCLRNTDISHILHTFMQMVALSHICVITKMCTRYTPKQCAEIIDCKIIFYFKNIHIVRVIGV